MTTTTVTPYSTVTPYATDLPEWAGPEASERLAAYTAYQNMYWSEEQAFQLIRRVDDGSPLYIPKPKVVCDTTAHYLLKGLKIGVEDPEKQSEMHAYLDAFMKRERFLSRFTTAKHAGVIRGDWLFHITADPSAEQGSRLSLTSIDPGSYFPVFDEDDDQIVTEVRLVEQLTDPNDPTKTLVHILHYWYQDRRVWREENLWKLEGWNNPDKAELVRNVIPRAPLHPSITVIPVYHFRNAEFDGFQFGNSELKGVERVFHGIDQAVSDEELALALVGLGVYATDAGRPLDENGNEVDWQVAPGMVWEMPGATMVKRLEGITSVTPVLDHVEYLETALFEATALTDVVLGKVDANIAESGIALALKFQPTLAKIEHRDQAGLDVLTQMWYDLKTWIWVYDGVDFREHEIIPTLGEKLPVNRQKVVEELNNMLDRKVISRKFYRQEVTRQLGYVFPATIEDDILAEETALTEAKMVLTQQDPTQVSGPGGRLQGEGDTKSAQDRNKSNNAGRTNESNGTEVGKTN